MARLEIISNTSADDTNSPLASVSLRASSSTKGIPASVACLTSLALR